MVPETPQSITTYSAWIRAGAKAQGWWAIGYVAVICGIAVGAEAWLDQYHSPVVFGVCAVVIGLGLPAAWVASKRERDWRAANPWTAHGVTVVEAYRDEVSAAGKPSTPPETLLQRLIRSFGVRLGIFFLLLLSMSEFFDRVHGDSFSSMLGDLREWKLLYYIDIWFVCVILYYAAKYLLRVIARRRP